MPKGWSEEDKKKVEQLLLSGLNLKEIAPLVGKTYGSVCGVAFRDPVLKAAQQERLAKMSHGDRYRHLIKSKPIVLAAPPTSLKPAAYDAKAMRMPLMDLKPNQCRYPVSHDKEHLFCGHARWNEATMYCEHHQRRCVAQPHVKPVKQRPTGFGE